MSDKYVDELVSYSSKLKEENEMLRAALKEIGVLSDYAESLDPGPVSVIVNKALRGEGGKKNV